MVDNRERKIILIGYRCTGKTVLGRRLARELGIPFVDTDQLVEIAAGKTIRAMVQEEGWAFFREKEREAIMALTSLERSVIATGGGAPMDEENAVILKKEGMLIWLVADEATILKRMRNDTVSTNQRPPLSSHDIRKEITDTLIIRTPVYRRLADFTVDTANTGIKVSLGRIVHYLKKSGYVNYGEKECRAIQ